MSNLSELLPTGGGQNSVDFVATGTLASGVTVALKTDGTVEAVATTSVPVSIPTTASPITYEATATYYNVSQFHPTNANIFVIAYGDAGNSNYGTAIVGTVSGNSITFSTPSVFESAGIFNISIAFDASNPSNFVIAYTDQGNSNRGTAVIGTISGTSLSYGTPVAFTTGAAADNIGVDFVSSNKFVVAYQDGGNSNYGTAIVGTVSGSSISYGSASVFESASTYGCALKGDPNAADVFVVAYLDNGNSNYGTAIVGTVSGSSISYGSATVFKAAAIGSTENGISFDPNTANKFVIMFVSGGVFTAIIGTRSGTSLSFGSGAAIQNNSVTNPSISYNPNTANEFLIAYRNNGNSNYGTATVCTVSSSTITVGTSYVYNAYLSNYNALTFDPSTSGKFAVSFYNANGTIGSTILGQLAGTGTNNTSFIGITSEAISNTATGAVNVYGGINEAQSGLTIASDYYVQTDGTLNTATSVVNYDIANASYTQAFSVSAQVTFPSGVAFNPTGTKMFVVDNTGDDVNEYTLSTGFDVSTASFVDSFSVNAQQAAPMSVAFNTDGTKMYIVGETEDTVAQYALSTGFDVSSASFTQAFSIASQETEAQGITFNTDGTKMFIIGDTGNDINEYTLSSGFDVSSASFVDSFSLASQTTQPKEGVFNTDGTELYVLGRDPQKVFKYTLTTGFDVSTASYASVEFSVASQETSPQGLAFSADGSKMYVCGDTGDDVNQYATTSTVTNSTTVKAGQAISATTINMKDLT